MNEGTAIEIARLKMKEMGINDHYIIRYRHLKLDQREKLEIKGENHHYLLVYADSLIKISSNSGVYHQEDKGVNENQHVHSGLITIENQGKERNEVKFIQVIPLLKQPKK